VTYHLLIFDGVSVLVYQLFDVGYLVSIEPAAVGVSSKINDVTNYQLSSSFDLNSNSAMNFSNLFR
jgi:hypothetical protein